jgi:hypothetical protein
MTYGLSVLVSHIPANLQVDLAPERYFRCGDETDLKIKNGSPAKKGPDGNLKTRHASSNRGEIQLVKDRGADR